MKNIMTGIYWFPAYRRYARNVSHHFVATTQAAESQPNRSDCAEVIARKNRRCINNGTANLT
jgi:hypothetical protein